MSRDKTYQLWVHFVVQNHDQPRSANEFCLVFETDNDLSTLYIRKHELEQSGNDVLVTKRVTLNVEVSDQPNTQQEG